jgi:hypothetical protein
LANTYTTRLNLAKPALGDRGWDDEINGDLDILDLSVGLEHNADGTHKITASGVFSTSHSSLTDMPSSINPDHDGRYYTETELGLTISGSSGATKIGVYDEFIFSNSSTVQGVLADLDSAIVAVSGSIVVPVLVHSSLTGLLADDHPQYLLTDGSRAVSGSFTISGSTITVGGVVVSGTQLSTLIDGSNADELHIHTIPSGGASYHSSLLDMPDLSGINFDHDGRYYTQLQVNSISGTLSSEIDSDIVVHSSSADHDGRYYTEAEIGVISGTLSSALTTHQGSTDHDGRYYTEAELNAGQLDNRYYTEAEVTVISGALNTKLDTHKSSADHDGRYYTETEIGVISGTLSSALTSHQSSADHDGRYYTETELSSTTSGTSGATKIGVYDEFATTDYTTLQDVLDDLDAAIAVVSGTVVTHTHFSYNFIDATLGDQVVNLPASASSIGIVYIIKKVDSSSYTVTITPAGADLIDDDTSLILENQNDAATLVTPGVNWNIV